MNQVRKIVSLGLEARDNARIRVRQPLGEFKIKGQVLEFKYNLLELIKDELNVKTIIFDLNIKEEVELNTDITPELKQEGQCRELIRVIQNLRKKEKLAPKDKIILIIETNQNGEELIRKFEEDIKKVVSAREIKFEKMADGEEVEINNLFLKIKIKK